MLLKGEAQSQPQNVCLESPGSFQVARLLQSVSAESRSEKDKVVIIAWVSQVARDFTSNTPLSVWRHNMTIRECAFLWGTEADFKIILSTYC